MRALSLVIVLVVPLLAGCLSGDDPAPELGFVVPDLDVASVVVPPEARLVETATGVALEMVNVSLPFETSLAIPAGAVQVSIEAHVAAEGIVGTYMWNEATGRRRCNEDIVDGAWAVRHLGVHRCSGLALIDPPGTNWTFRARGAVGVTDADLVRIHFERIPLDGAMAQVDFAKLSMPVHEVEPTTGGYVPSFDGVPLWVEVTLPEGDGPWPTVVAASPYNGQTGRVGQPGGEPAMWAYFTHDWAKRGYAIVNVDVRGFGLSGGCVEVWGPNEQRDQAFIVDWVAEQDWSDGRVGFYGQSYVGTTPIAAAMQAPAALQAIIAVAPVMNAYEDWHYGGVPNGENTGSPRAYQVNTDPLPQPNPNNPGAFDPTYYLDPVTAGTNKLKGLCDPTLAVRANDPRAIYDGFYEERNFKLGAERVTAAVLYTQGFEDLNVKSAMIPGWFNEVRAPKLGVFGHWVHQHPTRADEEILFLGWMDQWVKGLDLGLDSLPATLVSTNVGTERAGATWPPAEASTTRLWPDFAGGALSRNESDARGADLAIGTPAGAPVGPTLLTIGHEVVEDLAVAGVPHLELRGTLEPGGNAFIVARLYDVHDDRRDLVTYGMFNLAHNADHTAWTPVTAPVAAELPFLPTEYVFQAGHRLEVDVYGLFDTTAVPGLGLPVGVFAIGAHPEGVGALVLPTLPMDAYWPMPRTAEP